MLVPVGHLVQEQEGKGKSKGKMNVAHDGPQGLTQSQDWEALVERAKGQVIETMEARLGVTGLRGMIRWEEVNTPLTCMFPSSCCRRCCLKVFQVRAGSGICEQQERCRTLASRYGGIFESMLCGMDGYWNAKRSGM